MRLVVVATHPTDHLAPYLRALAARAGVELHVLFACRPRSHARERAPGGAGGGDPLLSGYPWSDVEGVRQAGDELHEFTTLRAPKLHRQLAALGADAVVATGWYSRVLLDAARGARRLRVPALLRGKWNDLQQRGLRARWRLRRLLGPFSAYLAVGRANRRLYERAGIAADRIFDAPYGVDNAHFETRAQELRPRRAEFRARWQISGNAFCVLFVGALDATRRPFDVLDAMEAARRDRSDVRLLLVGSGPLEEAVQERARERRLPVTFAGHLSADVLDEAYAAADALVLASDAGEAWGLVVNEAMASGIPTVVSDQVGCREDLIVDGVTGFSFRMGDARAMAACLTTLADDPLRAAAMGDAARDRVRSAYSISRAVDGTLAALALHLPARTRGGS